MKTLSTFTELRLTISIPESMMTLHSKPIYSNSLTDDMIVCFTQELLCENAVHVDGTAIERTGFRYEYPQLTVSLVKEVGHCPIMGFEPMGSNHGQKMALIFVAS